MSSAQHTPPASPPSMDQAATYPLPATDSGTKDYLFPLEPRPTRLVQFAEEDTLVKVHETWSPDEYDRKCLPFGRLVRRGNEKFVDQDAPRPQPDSSKPRRPFVRTNALRGADFLAAVNMDICDEPPATYASKITQPTPDFDPVSQASAVLLEAMQSRDWDTVVKLSNVCTDTSLQEFGSDDEDDADADFKHFFHNPGSDFEPFEGSEPMVEDDGGDSESEGPPTPEDEHLMPFTAMKSVELPTVRYVPPSGSSTTERLPFEDTQSTQALDGNLADDRDFVSAFADLNTQARENSPNASTSMQASATEPIATQDFPSTTERKYLGSRRWPSALAEKSPLRLFAKRHAVPKPYDVARSSSVSSARSDGQCPELDFDNEDLEPTASTGVDGVSPSLSFSSKATPRQRKKMQHFIANNPYGPASKAKDASLHRSKSVDTKKADVRPLPQRSSTWPRAMPSA